MVQFSLDKYIKVLIWNIIHKHIILITRNYIQYMMGDGINSVLVLDSGIGGLSVVSSLQKVLPNEDILYFETVRMFPMETKMKKKYYI